MPPPKTDVLLVVPPELTISLPPLEMVVPIAMPVPESNPTSCVPPLLMVVLFAVALP